MSEPITEVSYADAEHSPMGGSKAACFIACPGSVTLGEGLSDPESEYAAEGTKAHELAALCLKTGDDAWLHINEEKGITKEMADAVQVYLDDVRKWKGDEGEEWVEQEFSHPEIHKYFRGIVDFAKLIQISSGPALRVWDYKHGAGIMVEVEDNDQLRYYGVGMIFKVKKELNLNVEKVFFTIVQPRGHHYEGPVRQVVYTRDELFDWAESILIPAMKKAETSTETVAGEHCRFCPVRFRKCPALEKSMEELGVVTYFGDEGDVAKIEKLSNEKIGYYLDLVDKVKIVEKAMKTLAFQRAQAGQKIPGRKLVMSKANRVWKDEAETALVAEYKEQAFAPKELLSPAQIEKLPRGAEFAAQYAFKPPAGMTLAPESDKRAEVNTDTKSLFKPVKEKIQ